MISLDDLLILHEKCIADFGGASGVRDLNLLKSAIARPFQTYEGKFLHESTIIYSVFCRSAISTNGF